MKKILNNEIFEILGLISIGGIIGFFIGLAVTVNTNTPVEEIVIDNLELTIDSLQDSIKTLDSIRDVKIKEVKELDNDSTLSLFYELLRTN